MTDKDDVPERIAHLEGAMEAEEHAVDHRIDSVRHSQALLVGIVGLIVAAGVALLVYVLQRLDTLSLMVKHG